MTKAVKSSLEAARGKTFPDISKQTNSKDLTIVWRYNRLLFLPDSVWPCIWVHSNLLEFERRFCYEACLGGLCNIVFSKAFES